MLRNPIFQFADLTSTGIYQIPVNSYVLVHDTGSNIPGLYLKISNNGISSLSTINDFINSVSSIDFNQNNISWGEISGDIINQTDLNQHLEKILSLSPNYNNNGNTLSVGQILKWTTDGWINTDESVVNISHSDLNDVGSNYTHTQIDAHIDDVLNPHNVTATQLSLGNVDNTSDINKPISLATQVALNLKANTNDILDLNINDVAYPLAEGQILKYDSSTQKWLNRPLGSIVTKFNHNELLDIAAGNHFTHTQIDFHINDNNNPHNITVDQIGLDQVDNTSDIDKPISTLTQEALDLKMDSDTPILDLDDVNFNISPVLTEGQILKYGSNGWYNTVDTVELLVNSHLSNTDIHYPISSIILNINQVTGVNEYIANHASIIALEIDSHSPFQLGTKFISESNLNEFDDNYLVYKNGSIHYTPLFFVHNHTDLGDVNNPDDYTHAEINTFINSKSFPGGLCPLDFTRKVPATYLPNTSILEVPTYVDLPFYGQNEIIYLVKNENSLYAWYQDSVPLELDNSINWTGFYAGTDATLLLNNSDLYVLGNNNYFKLGYPESIGDIKTPLNNAFGRSYTNVKYIFTNKNNSFFIDNSNYLWGAGHNKYSQISPYMDTTNDPVTYDIFTKVSETLTFKKVLSSEIFTVGLDTGGSIFGWGYDDNHSFAGYQEKTNNPVGINYFTEPSPSYIDSENDIFMNNVSDFSVGELFTVVLRNDGTVWATGDNSNGQFGNGIFTASEFFTQITSLGNDNVAITSGLHFIAVLKSDGSIWTAGNNDYGQLGRDTSIVAENLFGQVIDVIGEAGTPPHPEYADLDPEPLPGDPLYELFAGIPANPNASYEFDKIDAGDNFIISLKTNQVAYGWGDNSLGQLGLYTNSQPSFEPIRIDTTEWSDLSVGSYHVLLKRASDNKIFGFGNNIEYALGEVVVSGAYERIHHSILDDLKDVTIDKTPDIDGFSNLKDQNILIYDKMTEPDNHQWRNRFMEFNDINLCEVDNTTLINDQVIIYDNTDPDPLNHKWTNKNLLFEYFKDINVTNPENNQLLFYNNDDPLDLFWENKTLELHYNDDVELTAEAENDVLVYESGKWLNKKLNMDNFSIFDTSNLSPGYSIIWNGNQYVTQALDINIIEDINITSPGNNQLLVYDGTNWVNNTIPIGALSNVNTSSLSSGDILYYNGSSFINKPLEPSDVLSVVSPTDGDTLFYSAGEWINRRIELTDIDNINSSNIGDDRILVYNSSISKFEFQDNNISSLNDVNTSGLISDYGLKWNGFSWTPTPMVNSLNDLADVSAAAISGNVLYHNGSNWTSASVGSIPTTGFSIVFTNLSDGDFLTYDETAGEWINSTLAGFNPKSLNDLTNVNAYPSTDEILYYDGSTWRAKSLSMSDLGDVNITSLSNDYVLYYNGSNWNAKTLDITHFNEFDLNGASLNDVLTYDGSSFVPVAQNTNITIDSISEFNINSPLPDQILVYDAGKWTNKNLELNDLNNINSTSNIVNQFLINDGSNFVNSYANLSIMEDTDISPIINDYEVLINYNNKWINRRLYVNDIVDFNINLNTGGINNSVMMWDANTQTWINGFISISDLADTDTTTYVDNQILKYNDFNQKWENDFLNLNEIFDVELDATLDLQVLYFNQGEGVWKNKKLILEDIDNTKILDPKNDNCLTYDEVEEKWINQVIDLEFISNVEITNPENRQFLLYNESTQLWENGADPLGSYIVLEDLANVFIAGVSHLQPLAYDNITGQWVNRDYNLKDLADTNINLPIDGDALIYNASTGSWSPGTVSISGVVNISLDDLNNVIVNPLTRVPGDGIFYDSDGNWYNGRLPLNEYGITEFNDVTIDGTVANNQVLMYLNGQWVNSEINIGQSFNVEDLANVNTTGLQENQVLSYLGNNLWGAQFISLENASFGLNDLSKVEIDENTLTTGQGLIYNEFNDKWENTGVASSIVGLNDTSLNNLSNNDILIYENNVWKNVPYNTLTKVQFDVAGFPNFTSRYTDTLYIDTTNNEINRWDGNNFISLGGGGTGGGNSSLLIFTDRNSFPNSNQNGSTIYVAADTNKIYRWSGTDYEELSKNIESDDAGVYIIDSFSELPNIGSSGWFYIIRNDNRYYIWDEDFLNNDNSLGAYVPLFPDDILLKQDYVSGNAAVARATTADTVGGFTLGRSVPAWAHFKNEDYYTDLLLNNSSYIKTEIRPNSNRLVTEDDLALAGGGDMLKSQYAHFDNDSNIVTGVVETAAYVKNPNNNAVHTVAIDVPSSAVFTDSFKNYDMTPYLTLNDSIWGTTPSNTNPVLTQNDLTPGTGLGDMHTISYGGKSGLTFNDNGDIKSPVYMAEYVITTGGSKLQIPNGANFDNFKSDDAYDMMLFNQTSESYGYSKAHVITEITNNNRIISETELQAAIDGASIGGDMLKSSFAHYENGTASNTIVDKAVYIKHPDEGNNNFYTVKSNVPEDFIFTGVAYKDQPNVFTRIQRTASYDTLPKFGADDWPANNTIDFSTGQHITINCYDSNKITNGPGNPTILDVKNYSGRSGQSGIIKILHSNLLQGKSNILVNWEDPTFNTMFISYFIWNDNTIITSVIHEYDV